MSATGRSDVRLPDDNYATPAWCVRRLLEALEPSVTETLSKGVLLEPCVGDGAIVRAVNDWLDDQGRDLPEWYAVEKRHVTTPNHHGDFLSKEVDDWLYDQRIRMQHDSDRTRFTAVITNPPYVLAQEFIERSMAHADWLIFLLRINYLASERRSNFMRAHPPDVYVLPNRPSFTGSGTDATEYAWFVWPPYEAVGRKAGRISVLASTPKSERIPAGNEAAAAAEG